MGKEPPASLRRDDGAQREVAGSGWVGAMQTGSPVAWMRAGRETEQVCGFSSRLVHAMGKTDGEASLVGKNQIMCSVSAAWV